MEKEPIIFKRKLADIYINYKNVLDSAQVKIPFGNHALMSQIDFELGAIWKLHIVSKIYRSMGKKGTTRTTSLLRWCTRLTYSTTSSKMDTASLVLKMVCLWNRHMRCTRFMLTKQWSSSSFLVINSWWIA